jgi:hypothetical protein
MKDKPNGRCETCRVKPTDCALKWNAEKLFQRAMSRVNGVSRPSLIKSFQIALLAKRAICYGQIGAMIKPKVGQFRAEFLLEKWDTMNCPTF